jgi:MbtH protein
MGPQAAPNPGPAEPALIGMSEEREDEMTYRVVKNHEEQYSIWPDGMEVPAGWRDAGKVGTKDECLAWIKEVWTDMRPASMRR